jgi:hypothetical protein
VHGEGALVREERSVLFLRLRSDGALFLQGMAQGHYPLALESRRSLLHSSPRLPELIQFKEAAVARLHGRELGEARNLIREALAR